MKEWFCKTRRNKRTRSGRREKSPAISARTIPLIAMQIGLQNRFPNRVSARVHVETIGTEDCWFRFAVASQHRGNHINILHVLKVFYGVLNERVSFLHLRELWPSARAGGDR